LRRCRESAASRCLRMPISARRLAFGALEEAARARGIELSIHSVAYREEIGSAIDAAKAVGAEGLNVLASALVYNSRAFIFDRTRALRLPAVYQWPQMAEEGGLIGYGPAGIVPL